MNYFNLISFVNKLFKKIETYPLMLAMELESSTYNLWLDFKWVNKRSLPTDKSKF